MFKKLILLVLCLGWALPVFAQAEPIATPIVIPAPSLVGGVVGSGQVTVVDAMFLRTGPFLGASALKIIPNTGVSYSVYARNSQEGEVYWYLIAYQETISTETTTETVGDAVTPSALTPTVAPTAAPVAFGEATVGWISGKYFEVDTPNANIPEVDSVFSSLTNSPDLGVVGITQDQMRLRQYPSYRTPTLTILDWGTSVSIISRTRQSGADHWYQVRVDGLNGWLYAPFVQVDPEHVSIVPIY